MPGFARDVSRREEEGKTGKVESGKWKVESGKWRVEKEPESRDNDWTRQRLRVRYLDFF